MPLCFICSKQEQLPTKPLLRCIICRKKYHHMCENTPIPSSEDLCNWSCSRCIKSGRLSPQIPKPDHQPNSTNSQRATESSSTVMFGLSKSHFSNCSDCNKGILGRLPASRRCKICEAKQIYERAKRETDVALNPKPKQLNGPLFKKLRRPKIRTEKIAQRRGNDVENNSVGSSACSRRPSLKGEKPLVEQSPSDETMRIQTEETRQSPAFEVLNASKEPNHSRPYSTSLAPPPQALPIQISPLPQINSSSQNRVILRELQDSPSTLQREINISYGLGHGPWAPGGFRELLEEHVSVNGGTGMLRAPPRLDAENIPNKIEDKTLRYPLEVRGEVHEVNQLSGYLGVNLPSNTGSCSGNQTRPQFVSGVGIQTTGILPGSGGTGFMRDNKLPQHSVGEDNDVMILDSQNILNSNVSYALEEIQTGNPCPYCTIKRPTAIPDSYGVVHNSPSAKGRSVTSEEEPRDSHGESIRVTLISSALQSKQKSKDRAYDETKLDSFLYAKSVKKKSTPLTEIADKMYWTHLSPRYKWPEVRDECWLERKQAQIQARGSRKAQFGKVITAEIIRERRERGWEKHQNKSLSMSDRLFDPPGIPEMVEPILVNGKLAMADATLDAKGLKPRRVARKVWMIER